MNGIGIYCFINKNKSNHNDEKFIIMTYAK